MTHHRCFLWCTIFRENENISSVISAIACGVFCLCGILSVGYCICLFVGIYGNLMKQKSIFNAIFQRILAEMQHFLALRMTMLCIAATATSTKYQMLRKKARQTKPMQELNTINTTESSFSFVYVLNLCHITI